MASVKAPVDVIGTGSYLPERWTETYATADVIAYDGAVPGQGRARVPVPSRRAAWHLRQAGGPARSNVAEGIDEEGAR